MSDQPTQSEQLVKIARELYRFHQSSSGEPFALPVDRAPIMRPLRGSGSALRARLAAAFLDMNDKPPTANALADALGALEGLAMRSDRIDVELRVARRDDGSIVVDLGVERGRFVVIEPGRWSVVDNAGVVFRRTALTSPMPEPTAGGDLSDLARMVNVDPDDLPLLYAWACSTFLPDIPHPLVLLTGEQGTGKSAAARTLAQLLDPSPAPLRTAPRDVGAWAVVASGSWLVALDNLSGVREWLSDALCRAATGDGMVTRRLYSDSDLSVLSFRRCVLLTSIDAGALRGDLAERLLVFELQRLGTRRRTEADLDHLEHQLRPGLLGALLDLTANVLEVLPTVELDELPRMADFARVVAAVDQVLGTSALDRYLGQASRIATDVVEADPLGGLLLDIADEGFDATTATLYDLLLDRIGQPTRPPKWFPGNARALAGQLKRLAPALRETGVQIENRRTSVGSVWAVKRTSSASASLASRASPVRDATPPYDATDAHPPQGHLDQPPPSQPTCRQCPHPPIEHPPAAFAGLCLNCARRAAA